MAYNTNRRASRPAPRRYTASRQSVAPRRYVVSQRPMRSRRHFAQEVDPDVETMVEEFETPEPEITDDTAPIEEVSGQGEVSDDLIEPELAGDSEAPVQDSVTARRRARAHLRRAQAEAENIKGLEDIIEDIDEVIEDLNETEEDIVEEIVEELEEEAPIAAKEAQEEDEEELIEDEEEKEAQTDAGEPIEDELSEEELMEEVEAKFSSANRLAALQKQHGCISRKADTVKMASRIAAKHTKGEIDYAVACLQSVGKAQAKSADSTMPRKASKAKTMTTYRKASKGISSDASALFM